MTEPVALADIKAHLRLDASAADEDDYLSALITAARRACEARINRSIVGADDVMVLPSFPGVEHDPFPVIPIEANRPEARWIALGGGQVVSITSIIYFDSAGIQQTLDPSAYHADLIDLPAVIAPVGSWPETEERPDAVTISYLVSPLGTDDLTVVAQAMRLLVGNWYRNREAATVDVRGTPTELPLAVTWLLDPLREWPTQ